MNKRWLHKPLPPADEIDALSRSINVNPQLATLLVQRGIKDFDEAKGFSGLLCRTSMIPT